MFTLNSPSEESSHTSTKSQSQPTTTLSQHQKFRKAVMLRSQLASLASEASNVHFERRLSLLSDVIENWKRGTEVSVVKVDKDSDDSNNAFSSDTDEAVNS
uniref:Uncharacterized protein n=1 Tax=Amphimedon queenslandica TaxID=400682 RepID=A0A1X7UW81_AMPQE